MKPTDHPIYAIRDGVLAINRNQLAAELNGLVNTYMYEAADDSQGLADELMPLLHQIARDVSAAVAEQIAQKLADTNRGVRTPNSERPSTDALLGSLLPSTDSEAGQ